MPNPVGKSFDSSVPASTTRTTTAAKATERSKSKSLTANPLIPLSLESQKAYDLIAQPNDWSRGPTTFFVGLRKAAVTPADFLRHLSEHVRAVANAFKSGGLRGYIVISDENYEVAYMNWESEEAMNKAFGSPAGQSVVQDAATMMENLQWSPIGLFDGVTVTPGTACRAK